MKRFEEGLNPKVEYRLSKPLDTVSALEIGLYSDGFRFHTREFISSPKLPTDSGFTWMAL
jgi:hypothetical protein